MDTADGDFVCIFMHMCVLSLLLTNYFIYLLVVSSLSVECVCVYFLVFSALIPFSLFSINPRLLGMRADGSGFLRG